MRLNLIISTVAVVNFLDALTTYIIVAAGGREVNPLISDIVNTAPAVIFFIHIAATAAIVALLVAADVTARRLPAALYSKITNFTHYVFAASVIFRIAVVLNNVLGIAAGVTPLADFFAT